MIRLFCCDLDDTLLNENHTSDDRIVAAVNTMIEEGYYIAINTGRSFYQSRVPGLENLYTVCCNGACIKDNEGNLIFESPIDKDLIEKMLEEIGPKMRLDFVTSELVYTTGSYEEILERMKSVDPKRKPADFDNIFSKGFKFNCSKEEILKQDIVKVNGMKTDTELFEQLLLFVEKNKDRLVNNPTNDHIIEITNKGIDKGSGAAKLAKLLGCREDQTAVYGDGGNDLPALKRFKHSYAPSTALKEAKEAAAKIIGPYNEYSVVDHMLNTAKKQKVTN